MTERACRSCIGVLAALFILSAAIGIPGRETRVWPIAAACGCAALLLCLWLAIHRRFVSLTLHALDEEAPRGYAVAPIESEDRLREIWQINCELYGEGALPLETYVRWWKKYPPSVHALWFNGRIEGGITIWPLRPKRFRSLLRGEGGLDTRDFYALGEAAQCRHWFVSGILIRPDARSPEAVRYLLIRALRTGLETSKQHFSGSICAMAYSVQGAKLLERFGFVRRKRSMPGGYPIYALTNIGAGLVFRMALRVLRYKRRFKQRAYPSAQGFDTGSLRRRAAE
jgi:hypothetical protein